MDGQELYNLHEAYMEIYNELDEEITPERRVQYKRGLKVRQSNQETYGKARPRKRATSPQPGAQYSRQGMTQDHRDTMRDAARYENPERPKGSGSLPKGKKLERQIKTGVSAESYDLYDIILSHLLDEGYAETPEAAEAMMVNMSEDWRDSIVEGAVEITPQKQDFMQRQKSNEILRKIYNRHVLARRINKAAHRRNLRTGANVLPMNYDEL